ncbi:hypothetical protein ACQ4LE_001393 [Meloidogyne hapla]|uniref:S1 motif domain-containing protein n=1 Tax=Meloidogyne hapla TaxID=6305 RepID=A0A1I8C0M3_MELHA
MEVQNSQDFDEETQIANVELRQRFLRFLKWLPNKKVEAKMFGANLNGIITAVDASNFDNFLFNKLYTPTGLVEHAALRTRDTIYLKISLTNNEKNNSNTKEMKIVQSNENKEINYQMENKNLSSIGSDLSCNNKNKSSTVENEINSKEESFITPQVKNSEENNIEEIAEMEVSSTSEISTPLSCTKSEGHKKKRSGKMSVAERMTRSTAHYLDRIK